MKVIFVFIFLCVLVTTSMSLDDKCNMEECVPISSCPIFNKLLRKNIMYPDDVNLLNSRKCWKTVDGQIFVCCKENKGFNETTTSVPTDPHNGNIETRTDVEAAPHFDHIEIKANVPAEPKCGNHGFSKNLIGGNLTSFDDYPWTALIQYTYRKFHDLN